MSAICTCTNADIDRSGPGDPVCRKCGAWWIPKYGSTAPRLDKPKAENPGLRRATPKIGRNDYCPCGSGRKFKKCCMPNAALTGAESVPSNGVVGTLNQKGCR